ncbi:MAG: hypothetical protein AAF914_13105 [Pseudomonadota bacterium]
MKGLALTLNLVFAACLALSTHAALAQSSGGAADRLPELLDRLADPETGNWEIVEREIIQRWSLSGSASADLLLNRGLSALEADEVSAAITHLTALVDHAPEFAEGWHARATAFYRAGLYGPALLDLQHALSLNPDHFGAMIGLGIMMEEMGEPELALVAFRSALVINPHRPDVQGAVSRIEIALEGETL